MSKYSLTRIYVVQVVSDLVKHVYAAPNQIPTIIDMQEVNTDTSYYSVFLACWIIFHLKLKMFMPHGS